MSAPRVAILATGDMGNNVGRLLRDGGAVVTTCLTGRSPRTQNSPSRPASRPCPTTIGWSAAPTCSCRSFRRARRSGSPSASQKAITRTGAKPVYVDCNAVSAATMQRIAAIIGRPARRWSMPGSSVRRRPRACRPSSTPRARARRRSNRLKDCGLDLRWVSDRIGDASLLKMSYGGLTKGLTALATMLMMSAERGGVGAALTAELADSQAPMLAWLDRQLPRMPPKAYRWVAEMGGGRGDPRDHRPAARHAPRRRQAL
ncbi:MAG: DUF1932 domain-containing protein [Pseudomonadota bacterium]